MEVSLALAFAAGLLSFVSPCVLALVPVYLAFLGEAAVPAADVTVSTWRGPALRLALLFVLGFSAMFILLGVSVGLIGSVLLREPLVRQIAGLAVIAIGLVTTGVFGPLLDRVRAPVPAVALPSGRSLRALALGGLVSIGWTPCIGPVLGAILTMGLSAREVGVAALLLVAYSAGLGVPFLAAALALPRVTPLMQWLRSHHRAVQIVSGAFIIGVGLLIVTNAFTRLAGAFGVFL